MRKATILGLVVCLLSVVPAAASVFTDGLSYDGVPDVIQDNSVSLQLFDNGDGVISPGDIFAGLVKWNVNITDATTFGSTTISVFSAMITAGPAATIRTIGGDPALYFTFGPVPVANPMSLASLLPTKSAANGGFVLASIGAILSSTPVGGPDLTLGTFAAGILALDTAAWGLDATFGIVAATDYFEGDLRDHDGTSAAATPGAISITDIDGDGWVDEFDDVLGAAFPNPGPMMTPGIAVIGNEAAAFSVIINNVAPVLVQVFAPNLAGTLAPLADMSLSPTTTLVQGTPTQVANGYTFADQAIASLNPVPEPSSILVWASIIGLAAGCGFWRRERR